MKTFCWPLYLTLLLLPLASAPVIADSLRCKNKLVRPGDTIPMVLARCGEPAHRHSRVVERSIAKRRSGAKRKPITFERIEVEEWTYSAGYGQFMRVLVFENGHLKDILLGPRNP